MIRKADKESQSKDWWKRTIYKSSEEQPTSYYNALAQFLQKD